MLQSSVYKPLYLPLLLFIFLFIAVAPAAAQVQVADTVRVIQILQGSSLREKTVDSLNTYQTIAGNVILKEGLTIFNCDSAAINKRTNVMEAFGNIHINQHDSIHTYSQYLRYVGTDRIAYLKKDVRLTDKKGILYTQELEYDLKTNIGKYKSGGKVVNGKTLLTSNEGVYYADTKDVFFKKEVHLVDPKYDIHSDSMQYNTQTQLATFITATYIKSREGGDIFTTNGTYDLKNGKAFFGNRSIIKDSTRIFIADNSAYDDSTGNAQLEGNAVIKDSVNGYTVLGNEIFFNKKNETFLATRKPVLIFKGEGKDSTFIAADTLFSGIEKIDSNGNKIILKSDTLKKTTVTGSEADIKSIEKNDGLPTAKIITADSTGIIKIKKDSGVNIIADSTGITKYINKNSTTINKIKKDSAVNIAADSAGIIKRINKDSTAINKIKKDSTATIPEPILVLDTLAKMGIPKDTATNNSIAEKKQSKKSLQKNSRADSSIRYFLAFHNVRIYNDSLQAVCDSLYYSSADSVFRLYQDPLVFSNKSQVSGDTINLYTKNKKADRIYVFENGIIINKLNEQMYNQIGGRTLNGYFKNGAIDYMRTKGSPAESVFYPQDDDSAYTGMNRCKGDVIDIYFVDKAVNKVKFINEVDGTLYPIRQIPEDQRYLKKFKWGESRRPKNKLELFE